jgi:hypothetical protein
MDNQQTENIPIKTCHCGKPLTTSNAKYIGEQDVSGIPFFHGKRMFLYNCPDCGDTVAHTVPKDPEELNKSEYAKKLPQTQQPQINNYSQPLVGYENHFPDVLKGFHPNDIDDDFDTEEYSGISSGLRLVNHPSLPFKMVVKPAQSEELNDAFSDCFSERYLKNTNSTHFFDNNFTTAHREALYAGLAHHVFGLGAHMPPTIGFLHNGIAHSGQIFIKNAHLMNTVLNTKKDEGLKTSQAYNSIAPLQQRQKLAIMNMVLGNRDRHPGNVLVDHKDHLHLIDHGFAFDYGHGSDRDGRVSYISHNSNHDESWMPIHQETKDWLNTVDTDKLRDMMIKGGALSSMADTAAARIRHIKNTLNQNPSAGLKQLYGSVAKHGIEHKNGKFIYTHKKGEEHE